MEQLEAADRGMEGAGPAVAIFAPDGRALGASGRFLRLTGASALPPDSDPDQLLRQLGFSPLAGHPEYFHRSGTLVRQRLEVTDAGLRLLWLEERPTAREGDRARFLSIAAHDLRGPIANVRGYASFLMDGRMNLEARARRAVEVILRNADRALLLLREFFDSAQAEQGPLEIFREEQALLPLLKQAIDEASSAAREQGSRLTARLPDALPETLVDKEAIEHVLSAFLEHGLARTPPGEELDVAAQVDGRTLRVAVADPGPPLDEQEAAHAYDRDRRTASEGKLATGFRLSLARAEVEAHGGGVGVEPRGDRTVFFFTLPL